MNKTTKQATTDRALDDGLPSSMDYERLMAFSSANVEAMFKGGEAVLRGLVQINEELMSFTSRQFKEQVEGGRAIAQCGTWSEILDKQISIAQHATERCMAEAGKLAGIAAEVTAASWAPIQGALSSHLREQGSSEQRT